VCRHDSSCVVKCEWFRGVCIYVFCYVLSVLVVFLVVCPSCTLGGMSLLRAVGPVCVLWPSYMLGVCKC
jgi:hypothetical protein